MKYVVISLILIVIAVSSFTKWSERSDIAEKWDVELRAYKLAVEQAERDGRDPSTIPQPSKDEVKTRVIAERLGKKPEELTSQTENGIKFENLRTNPITGGRYTKVKPASTAPAATPVATEPPVLQPGDATTVAPGQKVILPHPEYIGLKYEYTGDVDPHKHVEKGPVRHWYTLKDGEDMNFIGVMGMKADSMVIYSDGPVIWEYGIALDPKGEKLGSLKFKLTADGKEARKWDDTKQKWEDELKPFKPKEIMNVVQVRILKNKDSDYPVKAEFGWLP